MSKDNLQKITSVTIEFMNGEKHDVQCTMGVLIRYQALTGRNAFKKEDMQNMSPIDYVNFLACALYKEKPEEKVAELSDKVSGMVVNTVMEIVNKIFEQGEVVSKKDQAQPATAATSK